MAVNDGTVCAFFFLLFFFDGSQRVNPSASIRNDEVLRIVLVGKTGSGKSATGNTILGSGAFQSDFALESVTSRCGQASGVVNGRNVSLVDTPGLFDTRVSKDETLKKISDCISLAAPGPHGFLLVIKLDRFTDEEQRSVGIIQKVFGQKSNEYTMILFTNGDRLKGKPVEEMWKNSPKLLELVRACKGGYHVFNNETMDPSQVYELLEKIKQMVLKNGGSHYTNGMFQEAARKIKEEKEREREKVRQEMRARDIKVVGATTVASTVACTAVGTAAAGITAALVETAEFAARASVCGPVGTAVGALVGIAIGGVYWFRKYLFRKHREQSTETQSHQPVQAVRASMCQGDIDQSNSQCTCMAVTFLAYHNEGMRFDTSSLDNVLRQGDALYKGLMQQHHFDKTAVLPHLTIEQMPNQVFTDRNTCYSVRLDLSDLRVGFVKPSAKDEAKASHMLLLEEELQCLSSDVTHAFLIVAPECFAVFRDTSGRYGLFDSHPRSSTGLSVPEGKAILLTFHDLLDLARHFDKIFKDRSSVEKYEFVPVSFEIDHGSSETRVQSGTVQPATQLPATHDQISGTAEFAALASVCGPVGTAVGAFVGIAIGGVYWFRKYLFRKHREQSTETQSHQPVQAVRASMCQGDIDQSNSQCTCMAVTFLAYHNEGMRFDTSSLDNVLRQGDALYKGLMQQHHFDKTAVLPHLTIEQMPNQVFTDRNTCYSVRLDLSDLRVGFVKPSAKDEAKASHMLLLEEELQCLSSDVTHAFLIVAPECFAVFRDTSGRYGLFDSHPRSSTGLSVPEGKAILLTFHDLLDLARHFDKIFKDRSSVEKYEFVPVSFEIDHGSSETRVQSGTVQPATQLPATHDQISGTAEFAALASVCGPVGTAVGALVGIAIGGVYWFRKYLFRKHREQSTETQSHQPVQAVRASMCQGDIDQSNSQCTCMAVTFLAYHNEGMRFDTSSLDNVLRQGDALYKGLMQQHHFDKTAVLPHLTIEQMPNQVFTDRNTCYSVRLDLSDLRVGFVKPSAKDEAKASHMLLLEEELQCLSSDVTHAFLIVAPECFAVFRDTSGRYGLFDSHPRSSTGLSVPEGKAILLTFYDLLDLARHFDKIFKDRSSVEQYEFVPVSFEIDHGSSETRVQSGTVQPATQLPATHDQISGTI